MSLDSFFDKLLFIEQGLIYIFERRIAPKSIFGETRL